LLANKGEEVLTDREIHCRWSVARLGEEEASFEVDDGERESRMVEMSREIKHTDRGRKMSEDL
jgi:hypothetical protein